MRLRLYIVGVLFCATAVAAEDKRPRFGILDWFPFGWIQDGESHGMMVEMAKAIDDAIGAQSDIVVAPVPRVLRGITEGDYDFTITYRDTGMLKDVEYLSDIGCLRSAVVAMKPLVIKSLSDLNGLKVAYPGGGYFVKRFLPTLDLQGVEVAQTYIMFRMALRGRLDAFVINDAVWEGYRANLYPGFQVPAYRWKDFAEPYYHETLPIAVSIAQDSHHHVFRERIRSIMDNPVFVKKITRIYEKYALPNALHCLPGLGE